MGRRDRDQRLALAAMEFGTRAEVILTVLAAGDEEAIADVVAQLREMGPEGSMSVLDCIGEARGRRGDGELVTLVYRHLGPPALDGG